MESSLFDQEEVKQESHNPYSQSILNNDFAFQQTLHVHQGGVRALASLNCGYLMSGSIDKTTKLFMLNNATGRYDFEKELCYHNDYIYSICPDINEEGFFTGGKDCKIFKVDLLGNPVQVYEGHDHAVNSISQSIKEEFVSGSWDGTAKIWDVQTGKVKHTLGGHLHAVAVLSLANGITITGSKDHKIKLWYNGNLEKEFLAHEDIVRDFIEVPGIGFASCSNDETIKLWTIDGQNISTMRGHQGFIYKLTMLDSGEIVSASDDRTVRIWRESECVQIIDHPTTVLSVTKNHLGDIITGSEDHKIRTFTRDQGRQAGEEEQKEFKQEIEKVQQEAMSVDLSQYPDVSQLSKIKGQKDGEYKVFRNQQVGEAYMWKQSEQQWEKIGEVITQPSGPGGQPKTRYYEGDRFFEAGEYDHIFDVDIGDGINRKLPHDNGGNQYDSADRFLAREGLPRAYKEQIVQFLKTNSLSYVTSDAQQKKGVGQQQYGQVQQQQGHIPMKKKLYFDSINVEGPKKKLLEFNSQLNIIEESEMGLLDRVLDVIKQKQFYHSSKLTKQGFDLLRKLLRFPSDKAFPSLDIYRMFLMHPNSTENYKVFETGMEYLSVLIGFLKDPNSPQPTQLLTLRCLANLFENPASLYVVLSKRSFVVESVTPYLTSENKNIRNAAITVLLNYSVSFLDKEDEEGRIQCISGICEMFRVEKDCNNYLRLIATLGNLGYNNSDATSLISSMGVEVNLNSLEGGDDKTKTTIKEIAQQLKLI